MKLSSWLDSLKKGSSRLPFRRTKSRGSRRGSVVGKLSIETLEARTVPAFLAPVDYAVGAYPYAAISADFNGDTVPDLATADYYSYQVSVLLGNADGTFQPAQNFTTGVYPLGAYPLSLTAGDFDDDGAPDLATANAYGLSILMGNGDGTFDAPTNIDLGEYPASVAVGDLNGDGNLDLAATSNHWVVDYWGYYGYYGHYEGRANVLLGNGDGTFGGPQTTDLGYGAHTGAAVADFNEDGKDDFATTDGSSSVKVALANSDGSGNLHSPIAYTTEYSPHSISVGDFNSDGVSDLATANYNSVGVLLGNGAGGVGNGTFQDARNSTIGSYPSSMATGDFNDDGKLDVAVSSSRWVIDGWGYYGYYGHYENDAKVLLGYDNGHLAVPETTFVGLGWGTGIASADFNGDGSEDLALTNPEYYRLSVLINDEVWQPLPPPSVSISGFTTLPEGHSGSTNVTFTISLPFAIENAVTVHYETGGGTATPGSDYTSASANVTIPAGQTSVTVPITVFGDRSAESDEWFMVTISSADAPVGNSQGTCTIVDDEPTVYINGVSVTEGNSGSINATFAVTLSEAYDEPVTVHYATTNGSATAGSDFTGVNDATVTIPAGSTSQTFNIAVLGDRRGEDTEYFVVNLSNSPNAHIGYGTAYGYIYDNEPRIWIDDVAILEGTGHGKNQVTTQFVFTIHLSVAYDEPVTMNFATANGTATVSDNDYTARSGSVTFAAGDTSETVTITVMGDKSRENDEYFYLNLTNSSTNALMVDSQAMGWILDDDRRGRRW